MQNSAVNDTTNQAEQLICKIHGVLSCKIMTDEDGNMYEIHVLANQCRSPKQIARDIESALTASLGIHIEHRIISIAQIEHNIPDKMVPRIEISGVAIETLSGSTTIKITLSSEENTFTGEVSASMQRGKYKATANACLSAVNSYIETENFFQLLEVQKEYIAGEDIWIVMLIANIDGNEKTLCGSAIVRTDDYYAICGAVLDAVNRVLGILKKE
jgi:hypothetical protein